MSNDYFIEEFEWTRPRHGGNVTVAARILGVTSGAVLLALKKARERGITVAYINDEAWSYENERVYAGRRYAS